MKKHQLAIAVALFTFALTACDSKSETQKPAENKQPAATQQSDAKTSAPTQATTPSEDKKNISYMVGYGFGKNLQQTHVTGFDTTEILNGLNDGLAGKESKLTQQQMQTSMAALQEEIQKVEADQAKVYIENGKAFLADNAKRDGVITTKSGLQYEVVKKGTGAKPKETDVVKVDYEGKLIDGTVFDSSIQRGEPVEFAVNSVIPGWVEALQLMQVGEKVKLYIPSELAYGANGVPPVIPANSVLTFEVELLDVKKPEANNTPAKPATGKK